MSLNRLLFPAVLVFAALMIAAAAQNRVKLGGNLVSISGPHARMIVATGTPRSTTSWDINTRSASGLITIFNNLAPQYPNGRYWCCEGYNVMGPNSGVGEQWMAAAFTPATDHTVTRITVAAGYSQQGTNGMVISLNDDNNGVPGQALQTWNAANLSRFGDCCAVVVESDASGISVAGGKQYWIVLSTNSSELDTVDGWNVIDTDQVDSMLLASYTNGQWTAFQAAPGVGFALQGTN